MSATQVSDTTTSGITYWVPVHKDTASLEVDYLAEMMIGGKKTGWIRPIKGSENVQEENLLTGEKRKTTLYFKWACYCHEYYDEQLICTCITEVNNSIKEDTIYLLHYRCCDQLIKRNVD